MYRERLTITLEAELVAAIDQLIDRQLLRNRSQTIEHLLKEGIGLHELTQAVIYISETSTLEQILQAATFCQKNNVWQLFFGMPAGQTNLFSQNKNAVLELHHDLQISHVPTDFGTAGALLLHKAELLHPFLLITLNETLQLPEYIIAAYIFHRQHHAPLTRLLRATSLNSYESTGLEIASPEILTSIPSGIASLTADVFPVLEKEGKVRSYVTA